MGYLILVSILWAFSFGLIKGQLAGLDSTLVSLIRLAISLAVFAPLFRPKGLSLGRALLLAAIGAVQYGAMYVCYIHAFAYLKAHEVALFTIFTPLYVTLAYDLLSRKFTPLFWGTALLAVAGLAVVCASDFENLSFRTGFLLVQGSNVCFAAGQVAYKALRARHAAVKDMQIFALLYAGAVAATGLWLAATSDLTSLTLPTGRQWAVLAYLGVVASGVCFFLWNYGATRTDAGALAICNNLKIPAAMAVSMLFFGEAPSHPWRLAVGGAVILAALGLNEWVLSRSRVKKTEAIPMEKAS